MPVNADINRSTGQTVALTGAMGCDASKVHPMDECPICMDSIVDPTITLCGHTFCRECLEQSKATCGQVCPLCRASLAPKKRKRKHRRRHSARREFMRAEIARMRREGFHH